MLRKLKDNSKDRSWIIEAALAIFLPLIIFACSYYLGVKETKIPVELTLRFRPFDTDFFKGVAGDIAFAGDFSLKRDICLLLLGHFDPFFLLAVIVPDAIKSYVLYIGYFARLSLASLAMYLFLRRQVPLKGPLMVLLSVCYSLSLPVLGIASFTASMDTVIMLPILLGSIIDHMRDPSSVRKGIWFSIMTGVTFYVSGCLNLLSVLPLVLFMLLFVGFAVREKISSGLFVLLRSIPYLLIGIGFSAVTLVNTVTCSYVPLKKEDILNFEFRTTMFDLLLRFLNGKATDMSLVAGLGMGMTIFVLILLILFFLNPKIPLRLRVSLFAVMLFMYVCYSWRMIYRLTLLFVSTELDSTVICASRFAFLTVLLIFAAAICWRNISGISSRTVAGTAFAVIVLVVISNSSKTNATPSFFSMYYTGLCAIVCYFLIKERERLNSWIISGLVLTGLMFNLAFVLPISSFGSVNDVDTAIFDKTERNRSVTIPFAELDFFEKDNSDYLILYNYDHDGEDTPTVLRNVCAGAGVEPVFLPLTDTENIGGGIRPLIDDMDMMEGGRTVTSYKAVRLNSWEAEDDLVAYTDHKGKVVLIIEENGKETTYEIDGPSFMVIDHPESTEFTAKFLADSPDIGRKDRYILYSSAPASREIFTFAVKYYDGSISCNGPVTVLTGRRAGDILDIRVDGRRAETYVIEGKIALDIDEGEHQITISQGSPYLKFSLIAVLISVICSIVIILLSSRKRGETIGNV